MSPPTWAVVALFVVLGVGTVVRLASMGGVADANATARRQSLLTWWILAALLAVAVLTGRLGICVLLAVASWVSLGEYQRLVIDESIDRKAMKYLRALVPLTYLSIYLGFGAQTLLWLPLVSLVMAATSRLVRGRTEGYSRAIGLLVLGPVLLIFGPAHAALLLTLPEAPPLHASGASWFIFLIVLTELNDIAQALVGRRFGKHKITPLVSPNKTWEGLIGGVVVTSVLALILAPYLTSLAARSGPAGFSQDVASEAWPVLAGVVIALSGFLGDLNLSAIKRDVGVKDSSELLPGMGGALDRIDSLTLTAPLFYWLIVASIQ